MERESVGGGLVLVRQHRDLPVARDGDVADIGGSLGGLTLHQVHLLQAEGRSTTNKATMTVSVRVKTDLGTVDVG